MILIVQQFLVRAHADAPRSGAIHYGGQIKIISSRFTVRQCFPTPFVCPPLCTTCMLRNSFWAAARADSFWNRSG